MYNSDLRVWTVRRLLVARGFVFRRKYRGPHLTSAAKLQRIEAATKLLSNMPKNPIFVDESYVDENDHVGYQWVAPGKEPLVQHISQCGEKDLVFGLISRQEKRLVVLPCGSLDTERYIQHCILPNIDLGNANSRQREATRRMGH